MNHNRIADAFVGGWTANIAFSAQTGQPFSIQSSNNSTGGVGRANAVRVADPFKPGGTPGPGLGFSCATKTRTLQTWFNPCSFVNPPVAVDPGKPLPNPLPPAGVVSIANDGAVAAYGPRGRTLVYSAGFNKADLSLAKTFHFYRETGFKLRGDIFNVFNTPAYGEPNNYPGSSNFGQITSVNFAGRTVQLSGDFYF
jgi:hypothetical protein